MDTRICSKCKGVTYALFSSYVCDVCDPPCGVPKPMVYKSLLNPRGIDVLEAFREEWESLDTTKMSQCDIHQGDGEPPVSPTAVWRPQGYKKLVWPDTGKTYHVRFVCEGCWKTPQLRKWLTE